MPKKRELESRCLELARAVRTLENEKAERDYFIHCQEKTHKKDKNLINEIIILAESNHYNNPKARLDKIKELVSDYQSTN